MANTGDLIGYHAITCRGPLSGFCSCSGEQQIIFIPKEDFLDVLVRSEVLDKRLLKTLSHEFSVLANSVSMFAQKSVRERLALLLIVLREKYKVNFQPGQSVEINMSRDDLASLIGTARENVVRLLTEFKQDINLETNGRKIIVHDVNKLLAIANY